MSNRYGARCAACATHVAPGEGSLSKVGTKWATTHYQCPDADIEDHDAYEAYARRRPILDAWAAAVVVDNDRDGSGYYSTTVYRVTLPEGITAGAFAAVIREGGRGNAYAYGSFGGYSSIGSATDNGDGTADIQSVYHHGD